MPPLASPGDPGRDLAKVGLERPSQEAVWCILAVTQDPPTELLVQIENSRSRELTISAFEPAALKPSREDRRKTRRVHLITHVQCKITGDYTMGRSEDISEGGLLVVTGKTFDSQTEVAVHFDLPPYPPGILIEIQGVVVWARAAESMGIQFLEPSDQQREAIAKYIQLEERITQRGPL